MAWNIRKRYSVVSFALAVVFIIRLFSTSAFRVPMYANSIYFYHQVTFLIARLFLSHFPQGELTSKSIFWCSAAANIKFAIIAKNVRHNCPKTELIRNGSHRKNWESLLFDFLRMVNANGGAMLELHIVDEGTTTEATGCSVRQISLDGIYFDRGTPLRLGRTMLVPSAKADWLVVCNTPGIYEVIRGGLKIFNLCMVWFQIKTNWKFFNGLFNLHF